MASNFEVRQVERKAKEDIGRHEFHCNNITVEAA